MTTTLAVDRRPATAFLPIRSKYRRSLRDGIVWSPGADLGHLIDRSGETPVRSGVLRYQSTKKLTRDLILDVKSQAVWEPGELLVALLDVANIGGAWLRSQRDPYATFWRLWERSSTHPPQLTVMQRAQIALETITANPGVIQARVRDAAGGNVGRLKSSLEWLVANGYVWEVRRIAGSGEVLSHRLWTTGKATPEQAARDLGRALSLGLKGQDDYVQESYKRTGHRTTGRSPGHRREDLLHDRRMQRRGVRVWLREHRNRLKPYWRTPRIRPVAPSLVVHGPQTAPDTRTAAQAYAEAIAGLRTILDPPPPPPTPTRTTTPLADDGVVARLRPVIHRDQAAPADHRELAHLLPA